MTIFCESTFSRLKFIKNTNFVTCIKKIQYKSLVIVDLDTSFVLSNVNMLREWPKDA